MHIQYGNASFWPAGGVASYGGKATSIGDELKGCAFNLH
jgi:hypothetical protein